MEKVEPPRCWACAGPRPPAATYCPRCTSAGLGNPFINCRYCGDVRRRRYPGESEFSCTSCAPPLFTTERPTP